MDEFYPEDEKSKYSGYLGAKNDLSSNYENQSAPSGTQASAGVGAAGAISGNPYLLGASFLLNYLSEKEKAFQAKQAQKIALAQNQAKGEQEGLSSLNQTFRSALLK